MYLLTLKLINLVQMEELTLVQSTHPFAFPKNSLIFFWNGPTPWFKLKKPKFGLVTGEQVITRRSRCVAADRGHVKKIPARLLIDYLAHFHWSLLLSAEYELRSCYWKPTIRLLYTKVDTNLTYSIWSANYTKFTVNIVVVTGAQAPWHYIFQWYLHVAIN